MGRFTGEPVSFMNSNITGGFWKQRQDLFRAVTVDALYDRFKETGRFEAMKMNWREGMPYKPHIFWESDVTKWIEGAAYFCRRKEILSWKQGWMNWFRIWRGPRRIMGI